MFMENWKQIKGYEGVYKISNIGNVKSINYNQTKKEQLLKINVIGNGYLQACLYKNGKRRTIKIHVLVGVAFLNHKPDGTNKLVVDHVDGDKLNNRVENLRIITNRENCNRKHLKSSSKYVGVCWHKPYNKWKSRIAINGKRKHLGYFDNELDASNAYQKELKKIIKK